MHWCSFSERNDAQEEKKRALFVLELVSEIVLGLGDHNQLTGKPRAKKRK